MSKTRRGIGFAGTVLTVLIAGVLGIGVALGLTACDNTPEEEAIQLAFSNEIDSARAYDPDVVEELEESADLKSYIETLEAAGIDTETLWNAVFQHFDYTIEDVTVDGNSAIITMTATNADFTQILDDVTAQAGDWLTTEDGAELFASDQSAALGTIASMAIDAIAAEDAPTTTETVRVMLQKVDGNWELASNPADFVAPNFDLV